MSIVAGALLPHPVLSIPEVGKGEERSISAVVEAMGEIAKKLASLKPDTIVIISSHSEGYRDYFQLFDGEVGIGSMAGFDASDINFRVLYDKQFVRTLAELARKGTFPAGTMGDKGSFLDYGVMVPLYFLQKEMPSVRIVRLAISSLPFLSHYLLGKIVAEASQRLGRRTVVVASGDLSHHLSKNEDASISELAAQYEEAMQKSLKNGNFLDWLTVDPSILAAAGECGHRPLLIMAGALDGRHLKVLHHSHEVYLGTGYSTACYVAEGSDPTRRFDSLYLSREAFVCSNARAKSDKVAALARKAIEVWVSQQARIASPEEEPFSSPAKPVFVTIRVHGSMHGCIGAIRPIRSKMGEEIIESAISSAKDSRFPPLTKEDLPYLDVTVDVLGSLQRIHSIYKLDPKKYGVYVQSGKRHGFVLPRQEGATTIESQLAAAKRKAGIEFDEPVTLYRIPSNQHR